MLLDSTALLKQKDKLTLTLDDKVYNNLILEKEGIKLDLHNTNKSGWISFTNIDKNIVNSLIQWMIPKYYNTTTDIKFKGELTFILQEMRPYLDTMTLKRTYTFTLKNIQLEDIVSCINKFFDEECTLSHDTDLTNLNNVPDKACSYINLLIESYKDSDEEEYFVIDISAKSIMISSSNNSSINSKSFIPIVKEFCEEIGDMTTPDAFKDNYINNDIIAREMDTGCFYLFNVIDKDFNPEIIQKYALKLQEYFPSLHIESFSVAADVTYVL